MIFKRKRKIFKKERISNVASYRKERRGLKIQHRKIKSILKIIIKGLVRNKFVKFFFTFVIAGGLIFFGRYFLFSSKFDIKTVEIKGCKNIEREFVESKFSGIIGRNIFFIRASSLKEEVENYSPFIKSVKVEKHLPSSVTITLQERDPYFVWMNLSGCYLIDSEGIVLEIISDFENLEVLQEDIDLLKGYGNLRGFDDEESNEDQGEESEDVDSLTSLEQDPSTDSTDSTDSTSSLQAGSLQAGSLQLGSAKLTTSRSGQAGQDEIEEEELTQEEKYELVEINRNEVVSRVDRFWEIKLELIPEKYNIYPFIYSYEQRDYTVLESLDLSIISATKKCLDIDFIVEDVMRYIWESEFRFVINFKLMRKIVFSTRRDIDSQKEDLRVLIDKLKKDGKNFYYIDLSSDIIVYELDG